MWKDRSLKLAGAAVTASGLLAISYDSQSAASGLWELIKENPVPDVLLGIGIALLGLAYWQTLLTWFGVQIDSVTESRMQRWALARGWSVADDRSRAATAKFQFRMEDQWKRPLIVTKLKGDDVRVLGIMRMDAASTERLQRGGGLNNMKKEIVRARLDYQFYPTPDPVKEQDGDWNFMYWAALTPEQCSDRRLFFEQVSRVRGAQIALAMVMQESLGEGLPESSADVDDQSV